MFKSTPFLKAFMCNFTFFDRIPEEAYLEFLRINFHEVFWLNQNNIDSFAEGSFK